MESLSGEINLVVLRDAFENNWLIGGEIYPNASSVIGLDTMRELIEVTHGEHLAFSKDTVPNDNYWRINFYGSDNNYISRYSSSNNQFTLTVSSNVTKMWVSYPQGSRPQIVRGTEFIPYRPNIADQITPTNATLSFTGSNAIASVVENDGMGGMITTQLPTVSDLGVVREFVLKADSGYQFVNGGSYNGVSITNLYNNNTVASFTTTITEDINIIMDATLTPLTETIVRFNGLNVSVLSQSSDGVGGLITTHYPTGIDVTVTLGVKHNFTLSADLGYEFSGDGTYNGNLITDVTPDKTQAYFTVTITEDIVIELNAVKSTVDVTGFNRIYQLTTNELSDFATQRFLTDQEQDLGAFIINVLNLPFQVPPTYSGEREPIRLGNYSVNTVAEKLKSDELEIDVGTVTVPSIFNNSYDYLDTEATIHLPYSDSIKLDLNYVLECEVSVKYYLDVYTGATTINITSSKVGEVIQSNTVTIGTSIPFITRLNEVQNKLEKDYINNKLTQAYIEISRNQQQNKDNPYQDVINTQGVLTDELGFISVEDIQLITTASIQEIDMIRTQLREGVIING